MELLGNGVDEILGDDGQWVTIVLVVYVVGKTRRKIVLSSDSMGSDRYRPSKMDREKMMHCQPARELLMGLSVDKWCLRCSHCLSELPMLVHW